MSLPRSAPDRALLAVEGLSTVLDTEAGPVTIVDRLDFSLRSGETLAIVGESGSGKSMTALSLMRLLPERVARIAGGHVLFEGRDLVALTEAEMRRIRGAEIAMIFQEPMTSLNPVLRIGRQIIEVLDVHRPDLDRRARHAHAAALLARVRIADPERMLDEYPHQLSGGMHQRVMIAMALACDPKILIADEATTALDATVQAQILDLLAELKSSLGLAILLITHNLGIVAENAERALVMYAGRKVEDATVADLFAAPGHPYTRGLLAALPQPRQGGSQERRPLREIRGMVPPLANLPQGCAFAPRCPLVMPICTTRRPPLEELGRDRAVACFAATEAST
jgi:oligopeptide/dipeptide ABC transporter ATP-binding protein